MLVTKYPTSNAFYRVNQSVVDEAKLRWESHESRGRKYMCYCSKANFTPRESGTGFLNLLLSARLMICGFGGFSQATEERP